MNFYIFFLVGLLVVYLFCFWMLCYCGSYLVRVNEEFGCKGDLRMWICLKLIFYFGYGVVGMLLLIWRVCMCVFWSGYVYKCGLN